MTVATEETTPRGPAFANAYAISFRLLGDAELAAEVAAKAAERLGERGDAGGEPGPREGLAALASRAVDASLAAAGSGSAGPGEVRRASERERLRTLFSEASPQSRVAAALVHLAGYPEEVVAGDMDITSEQVRELIGDFRPATEDQWLSLGDPALSGSGAEPQRRRPGVLWAVAAACALGALLWFGTRSGERPELEPGSAAGVQAPEATEQPGTDDAAAGPRSPTDHVRFGPDVPVGASRGCNEGGSRPVAALGEFGSAATPAGTYALDDPETGSPVPMVVLIGEPGLPAARLGADSSLVAITGGSIHLLVDPTSADVGPEALAELLAAVLESHCVDVNRVSVVGFGAGGSLAGRLTCSVPELLSTVSMVAGWSEPGCEPDPAVTVSVVGATDDPTVDTGTALEEVGTAWADALGAADQEVDGRDEETLVRTWRGPGGLTVQTTTSVTGGHGWTLPASLSVNPVVRDLGRVAT